MGIFKRNWWPWLGAFIIAGLITTLWIARSGNVTPNSVENAASQVDEENSAYSNRSTGETISEDLEVFEVADAVDQHGRRYIVGKVRSKSGKQYTYVELNFTLHDATRSVLGAVTANNMGLKADSVWEFRAEVHNPQATKYRLARSYGW